MHDLTVSFRRVVEEMVDKGMEVNVWGADEEEMKELGKKWLKDRKFHEVISWPLEETGPGPDGVWRLGDVVVWEKSLKKEYWVKHGIRHLLGMHHDEGKKALT